MIRMFDLLSSEQRAEMEALDHPAKIQAYLDQMPYIAEDRNRAPLDVVRDHQSHCLDGGLFGAAALRRIGFRPLVMELWPEPGTDDDHVLAIFQVKGCWGALAKSNFPHLRFREPVFRSLRELVMSYFEVFCNLDGLKTLRCYSRPLDLSEYDHQDWETDEGTVARIEKRLYRQQRYPVITPEQAASLSLMDERTFNAAIYGVNPDETYKYRPH